MEKKIIRGLVEKISEERRTINVRKNEHDHGFPPATPTLFSVFILRSAP
jgi:hypothetical protein